MNVLSTKKLTPYLIDQAKSQYGFNIICQPFTEIKPVDFVCSPNIIDAFDAIAFTSANAVLYFLEKPLFRSVASKKIIVSLEGATRKELQLWNLVPKIIASNAVALGKIIRSRKDQLSIKKLLHPVGNLTLPILREEILKSGIEYHDLHVYNTELCPLAVDSSPYEAILFFSPSIVDSFAISNRFLIQRIYVCIGLTTYNRLRNYSEVVTALIADNPSPESMLMALHNKIRNDKE
jgi:uroporphyrinogen-III synthase